MKPKYNYTVHSDTVEMWEKLSADFPNNDNTAPLMTGNFGHDATILQEKWGIDDEAFLDWSESFSEFAQSAIEAVTDEGSNMIIGPIKMDGEPAITAAALGLVDGTFSWLKSMGIEEQAFVLDEIARHFNIAVRNLRQKQRDAMAQL